tara:strand:+ start:1026 stop:1436 length:411 start_codon:yes stop_codon:yes gene_type:complete
MNANAIINIAKSQLGLEEDDYRAVLERTTGKASLRLMTNPDKLKVIDEMKRLGFKAKTGKGRYPAATKPYIRLIHALWKSCHRLGVVEDGSRTALRAFCANRLPSNVSTDPDLLNYEQASPIIEALKSMEKRGKAK